ncbi:MAG: hypothetical protein C0625_08180 [Arcobacter sp.]|nr:MAG: hypothetical protein C0625_08180 [Arcobacter sp.]
MLKSKLLINLSLYIILSIIIYIISNIYIYKEVTSLLDKKYSTISTNMKKNLSSLIEDKRNATLAFGLSVSKDISIKKALLDKNKKGINLKAFSKELKEKTKFKNVWFQIIDDKGRSFYRSWNNKTGDSLLFRQDLQNILKSKKIQSSISVGKFDMTFKTMVPIFEEDEFLGIFEIITHFNSISKILHNDKIDLIALAHKKYRKNIILPFTKKFIGDYYIANLDAKDYLIKLLEENNIEELLKIKNYKLVSNNILTTYTILELDNEIIGYVVLAKNMSHVNIEDIKSFKKTSLSYVVIFIVLIGFLFTFVSYYLYSNNIRRLNSKLEENLRKIKIQEKKNQTILDSQKNIIVITDGNKIKNTNLEFFVFFSEYSSLNEFKKDHDCICERFEKRDDFSYVIDTDYNGKNWAEYILANPEQKFKAAIFRNNLLHHFTLNVNISTFDREETPYIIVTLTDITQEIEQQEKLKTLNEDLESIVDSKTKELKQLNENLEIKIQEETKKNKEKDRLLFQQSKMASMGEMLENIAHQWRQPLNSISTAASSIKLENELKLLDDLQLEKSCDFILKNSQYLSKTIEDFKNFFKEDREKQEFLLKNSILENLGLLKDKLKHENIQIIVNVEKNELLYGYKNEFQQALLNILNNSIDAFYTKEKDFEKVIILEYKKNILEILDNAGGVKKDILEKIFEPYFTTKHQSQGTGIGLYMTENILVNHMNCLVNACNENFKHNNKFYDGLKITIEFNN